MQLETSEINVVSSPIGFLSGDDKFNSTLKLVKTGWLFSNANSDKFPHEPIVDGDVVPSFIEKLLSAGFHNLILGPGDTPTCEEACLTSWHLMINCIYINFVHEITEKGITSDTKPFVPDFPLNVWLFENLTNSQAKSFVSSTEIFKPIFHAMINIPSTISASINHLELLFLMRLGDSLNNFQLTMEEIFTFKSDSEYQMECPADSNKQKEPRPVIKARKNQKFTDTSFKFTACVLIKHVLLNAFLPQQKDNRWINEETEDTPTGQSQCKVLLRPPTESPDHWPPGESYESNTSNLRPRSNAIRATISSPVLVEPDPSLQSALQKSLPGTPKILTPRSQSPSAESHSTGTPTSLSHYGSLSSMNIDDATNQFGGYQEDDYCIIDSPVNKTVNEKDNSPATTRELTTSTAESTTEDMSHEFLTASQLVTQDYVKQKPLEHLSQVPSQSTPTEIRNKILPSAPESSIPDENDDSSSLNTGPTKDHQTQQIITQPHKHLPPTDIQGEVEEAIPDVHESSQQALDSAKDATTQDKPVTSVLPTSPSITLENEDDAETLNDLDKEHSFRAPPVEELQWQLQVSAFNVCAIPIINPTGLIAKLSAGRINLKEDPVISVSDSTEMLEHKDVKVYDEWNEDYDLQPSVRGRIELGPRIYKYYPTLEELDIPCVVQLYVNGVNASLLLSLMENLTIMFEDEIKAMIPVPLYIILEGNQFFIMESPDGHAGDFNTLNVSVDKVCIQRGPEVPKLAVWKAEHLGGEIPTTYGEATPVAGLVGSSTAANTTMDSTKLKELDTLLSSIKSFTANLQPQLDKLSNSSQVHRINQVLLELQNAVGTSGHPDPPPRYSESVDHMTSAATIESLHNHIESLQKEQQKLQEEVKDSREQLEHKDTEMKQLVDELVKSKDSEVTMKEVVFRLNNQIQDVVMENDQLKVTMARAGLRVPIVKKQ